jgi:hypothetical protein
LFYRVKSDVQRSQAITHEPGGSELESSRSVSAESPMNSHALGAGNGGLNCNGGALLGKGGLTASSIGASALEAAVGDGLV